MAIDPDDKQDWHNRGQEDASEGRDKFWAEPWRNVGESQEDYKERHDAWEQGYDNTSDQKSDSGSSSGCFLTTACVEYAGLSDDCRELQTLRLFRDEYVANLPDGQSLLTEYYREAPTIVRCINASRDRCSVLVSTFQSIKKAVEQIDAGNHGQALTIYRQLFEALKGRYLSR